MPEIKLHRRVKYAGDVHATLMELGWDAMTAAEFCDSIPDADVVERPRWISVKERLPEPERRVVLFAPRIAEGGTVRIGWLEQTNTWFTEGRDRLLFKQVTHWMPLPETPVVIAENATASKEG